MFDVLSVCRVSMGKLSHKSFRNIRFLGVISKQWKFFPLLAQNQQWVYICENLKTVLWDYYDPNFARDFMLSGNPAYCVKQLSYIIIIFIMIGQNILLLGLAYPKHQHILDRYRLSKHKNIGGIGLLTNFWHWCFVTFCTKRTAITSWVGWQCIGGSYLSFTVANSWAFRS